MKTLQPTPWARQGLPGKTNPVTNRLISKKMGRFWLPLCCLLALFSCKKDDETSKAIQPTGEKPDWGPTIDAQMQAVIEQFESFNTPPLPQLSARQARMTPWWMWPT